MLFGRLGSSAWFALSPNAQLKTVCVVVVFIDVM